MQLRFVSGRLTVLTILVLAIVPNARVRGAQVTTAKLLDEMTNLAALAEFPSPSYRTRQFSSYDRASKSPGNDAWFANDDRGQYLRTEKREDRTEHVMMDYAGAGAVVRIWSANPRGNLRIYLDGAESPAIEANMEQLLGGKHPAFPVPIAGVRARGYNLYFPIPFAKHCKITSDEGEFYYIVNYRAYDAGTEVETFKQEQLRQLGDAIQKAAKVLRSPIDAGLEPRERNEFKANVEPGASAELGAPSGAGAITQFLVRVNLPRKDEGALRGLVLEMEFDGEKTVEAPLGDFFGSAVSLRNYASLPMGVEDRQAQESSNPHGELWSHWVMPFEKSAVVRVRNEGKSAVGLTGTIGTAPYEWNERSMHFHAGYRARFDFPTRPHVDWNYLSARGKGVFAGVSLAIDNPVRAWWGEGDEKIYVDGESFPSWFGTGSEDYFGYAWCDPTPFGHAYHNQPRCDGPGNYGRTFVNRFHIMDRIPFTEQFRFDMELWHWADVKVNQAVTTYWYARPGATDDYEPLQPADLAVRPMPAYEPPKVAGAIEGEQMKVLSRTATVAPQSWDGTSGDHHIWWHGGVKEGDQLVLGFTAPKPGRYRVLGRFLKARDYGTHQLAINGTDAGKPIDLFNQKVIVSPEIELGVFELKKQNELSVRVVGANPQADKQHMFGLDYLRLEPVREPAPAKSSAIKQSAGAKAVGRAGGDLGPNARPDARQFLRVYDLGMGESKPVHQ